MAVEADIARLKEHFTRRPKEPKESLPKWIHEDPDYLTVSSLKKRSTHYAEILRELFTVNPTPSGRESNWESDREPYTEAVQLAIEHRSTKNLRRFREEFDNYTSEDDRYMVGDLNPRNAHQMREIFGSQMPDERELDNIQEDSDYRNFSNGLKNAFNATLSAITACGITTIGELRRLEDEAIVDILSDPKRTMSPSAKGFVFAQTVFKKIEESSSNPTP